MERALRFTGCGFEVVMLYFKWGLLEREYHLGE